LAKKEESKKKAQAREKEEHLEARREVHTSCYCAVKGFRSRADITCLAFSSGVCSQSRLPRTPQKSKRHTVASSYSVRPQFLSNHGRAADIVTKTFSKTAAAVESDSDSEEWAGIVLPSSSSSSGARHGGPEDERDADAEPREYAYSDEEQLATVTVVEDFDPSALLLLRHDPVERHQPEERASSTPLPHSHSHSHSAPLRPEKVEVDGKGKSGPAKKKVRYETKAARKATRATQRARRTEKAERAGGKAARRKGAGGKNKNKKSRG